METIDEIEGKCIIFCHLRSGIADICRAISAEYGSDSFVEYHGGIDQEGRDRAINGFQDGDSPVRFFVGNQTAAGLGLTLTAASTVIYYSNSYSLDVRLQSEDRAHRIGQTKNVLYIDFVSTGTVDEKVLDALMNKSDIAVQATGMIRNWIIEEINNPQY